MCAAKHRPLVANYLTRENYTVGKKRDHDDHTFSGIMFDVKCRTLLPVHALVVRAVCVRGGLGEMRVFVTKGGYKGKQEKADEWQLVHHAKYESSMSDLVELPFDAPVAMSRGDVLGVYVHCSEDNDQGVVYDNQRQKHTFTDKFIRIMSGMADLSSTPFSNQNPWGSYSNSWRRHREFVGSIRYGVKYSLWNPKAHSDFPKSFKEFIRTMLLIDNRIKRFPKDVFLYILNMCHWSWGGDDLTQEKSKSDEEDDESAEDEDYRPHWLRGNRNFYPGYDSDSNDDDDGDDEGGNGQYYVVDAARLLLMRQLLGNAFPFVIPEGTGPGDQVILRLPRRAGSSSSTPSTVTTYDILYDDGDRESGVPASLIRLQGSTTAAAETDLQVDTQVMVNWKNRGQFFAGKITAVHPPAASGDAEDGGDAAAADDSSSDSSDDDSTGDGGDLPTTTTAEAEDAAARKDEKGMDALD